MITSLSEGICIKRQIFDGEYNILCCSYNNDVLFKKEKVFIYFFMMTYNLNIISYNRVDSNSQKQYHDFSKITSSHSFLQTRTFPRIFDIILQICIPTYNRNI